MQRNNHNVPDERPAVAQRAMLMRRALMRRMEEDERMMMMRRVHFPVDDPRRARLEARFQRRWQRWRQRHVGVGAEDGDEMLMALHGPMLMPFGYNPFLNDMEAEDNSDAERGERREDVEGDDNHRQQLLMEDFLMDDILFPDFLMRMHERNMMMRMRIRALFGNVGAVAADDEGVFLRRHRDRRVQPRPMRRPVHEEERPPVRQPHEPHHQRGIPLLEAAVNGDLTRLRSLLDSRVFGRVKGEQGQTALHEAAKHGHLEVVRFLYDLEGLEKETDNDNHTPLHYAAEYGHVDIVRFMLEKGAEVDVRSRFSATPLHKASRAGHSEIVRLLVDHGADIHGTDNKKRTALHKASLKGHSDVVLLLLERGAEIEAKTTSGQTALCKALKGHHGATVRCLLEEGADINAPDREYGSLLFRALETKYLDAMYLVIRMNPQFWFSIRQRTE